MIICRPDVRVARAFQWPETPVQRRWTLYHVANGGVLTCRALAGCCGWGSVGRFVLGSERAMACR